MRLLIHLLLLLCLSSTLQAAENNILLLTSSKVKGKVDMLHSLSSGQLFELQVLSDLRSLEEEQVAHHWAKADLVLLDGINPALSEALFAKYQHLLEQYQASVVALGNIHNKSLNKGLNTTHRKQLDEYFSHAGRDNLQNMMLYVSSQIFNLVNEQAAAPKQVPRLGLYHPEYPDLLTADSDAFFNWLNTDQSQPLIALATHRSAIDYEQTQVVDQLLQRLKKKGANAFAFYFDEEDSVQDYQELFINSQNAHVNLIINYRSMHYIDKRRQEFEALGVPVIQALNYSEGDEEAFKADSSGISANLTPFFLTMPEDAGAIDPVVIAATEAGNTVAIDAQLNALAERAYNHARLALLDNSDKKIATFIWNYPPGEKNIGAAFLDVPASVEQIATTLKAEGYFIEEKEAQSLIDEAGQLLRPYYRGESASTLIDKGLADYLPLATYLEWFNNLPTDVQAPIIERWGKPQDNQMLVEHNDTLNFVIPRMTLGNLIVLPQGLRGDTAEEHSQLYHDTQHAINHSYLATYLYVRDTFAANAIIHLGTHGSQEWLTGKERGLSVYDAPDLVIGHLPVFYPYIIDNVGEAMQAKRRGRATTLSYLTPGFAKAGLYADVALLSDLVTNYVLLDEGQTQSNTKERIITLMKELNFLEDLQLTEDEVVTHFDQHISVIEDQLEAVAKQSQPLGVHTFGLLPQDAHLYTTILQILGDEFTQEAAQYEQLHNLTVPIEEAFERNGVIQLEALEGFQLLKAYIEEQPLNKLTPSLEKALMEGKHQFESFHKIAELENLVGALAGRYIPTSYGGDPIRNPQVAPTGRNLIGFNPAKVPSPEAYQAGVNLMEDTIADYVAKHGRYPEKLAFSLWSLETMRHQGALEAQILHAMGVKPTWNRQGQVIGTEIIPYSELKRPRIDVVITPTGLYRDAFPNVMLWIAEAVDKVARLKEDNNFLHRNHLSMKQQLIDDGADEQEADYLSTIRIFSNRTGHYGTGLASATLNSGNWDTDAAMSENYLQRMGFAYGKDESRWSEEVESLQLYSKALSGTDGVIFSRSTNLYALMTNDDPFQYFGGIGLAVRHLDGKTPDMYVSNLRRNDDIKVQTMESFINQEFRSRYFHPRWIEEMQNAGYAGALNILDRMNNMWGWEVMTPEAIRDDHWQEFFDVYIDDKYELNLKAFFEEHNPDALAQILERMLEAVRKDYWPANEQTLRAMLEMYTELANTHDVFTDNDAFTEFVDQQATGFGITPLIASSPTPSAPAMAAQPVTGQKLEQVKLTEHETHYKLWFLMFAVFALGLVSPLWHRKRKLHS